MDTEARERQAARNRSFDAWFASLSGDGSNPHAWQRTLASREEPRSQLIRIPTGMGKTLGVLAAWAWHRVHVNDDRWPRRLVWCLPMRVLVEQTVSEIRAALDRLGLSEIGVHCLMGGSDPGDSWHLYPEKCAILVGTQDMLLSRALNRGYGSGRARWPVEFGLLSHDALWVMDEVQLMDVGLATSAQLQAFHDEDRLKGFRPRLTWWMSATLQPAWLRSVDTVPKADEWQLEPCILKSEEFSSGLPAISKSLATVTIGAESHEDLATRVLAEHEALEDQGYGRITLVICNTVRRASAVFDTLQSLGRTEGVELIHSRFRPYERAAWRDRFLSKKCCTAGVDRIIVATQVVEAGVDISAGCVVTELAPWPSLVQRFGRCARYGGQGHVVVVDRGRDEKAALPYGASELEAAWSGLQTLHTVGISALESFDSKLSSAGRERLYPYAPKHLLLRRELDELFDTTPDLTGADIDISRFIRSGDERDLQVFWIEIPVAKRTESATTPADSLTPRNEELCAIPFLAARDWLCGSEKKDSRRPRLRDGVRAWIWDFVDGAWRVAERSALIPGRIVCVSSDSGGYDVQRGFTSDRTPVSPVPSLPDVASPTEKAAQADASETSDTLSHAAWKTIACHTGEVVEIADAIADAIALRRTISNVLRLACIWHDLGKSHPAVQDSIKLIGRPDRQDLAKAPDAAWPKFGNYHTADNDARPGFRHELASALALFAVLQAHQPRHAGLLGDLVDVLSALGHEVAQDPVESSATSLEQLVLACTANDFDLLVYLVACHHGKVRMALHVGTRDQEYRIVANDNRGMPIHGVRSGDVLPPVTIARGQARLPSYTLSLEPAALGLSARTGRSWRERTLGLLNRFGPGALAWLESLVRAADCRASALTTADPELASVARAGDFE